MKLFYRIFFIVLVLVSWYGAWFIPSHSHLMPWNEIPKSGQVWIRKPYDIDDPFVKPEIKKYVVLDYKDGYVKYSPLDSDNWLSIDASYFVRNYYRE